MPDTDLTTDPRIEALSFLHTPLCVLDVAHWQFVWANSAALSYWQATSLSEFCEKTISQKIPLLTRQRIEHIHERCYRHNQDVVDTLALFPSIKTCSAELNLSPFPVGNNQQTVLVQVVSTNETPDSKLLPLTTAVAHTPTMISVYDTEYSPIYCNPAAQQHCASHPPKLTELLHHEMDIYIIEEALEELGSYQSELEVNTDKGVRWYRMNIQISDNSPDDKPMVVVSATDATEQRQARQEAYSLAYTDSLTGLPNRAALTIYLDELLGESDNEHIGTEFSLFFLDLDRFKIINDSLGHAVGDQLLKEVSKRLKRSVVGNSLVCRLGGDEFVVILNQVNDKTAIQEAAERVINTMHEPATIDKNNLRILPSIGISRYPNDGKTAAELLERADAAMYMAKSNQTGYCFYNKQITISMNEAIKGRLELENRFSSAIENNEFELYYQAKISCHSLEVSGVEALLRWNHPERGQVPPDCFIEIAEESGQILELGNWVLDEAMRQQKEWQEAGQTVAVSINISAHQFNADNLLLNVSNYLKKHRCDPSKIELEITESMLLGDVDQVNATLQRLSSMGIRLALDDFGKGYSNLVYLQQYPLDVLKIDRAFLANGKQSMLMGTILNMGKVLGLDMVAEGVETQSQADWLIANGCDHMQGYLYSVPAPAAKTFEFLKQRPGNGPCKHKAA